MKKLERIKNSNLVEWETIVLKMDISGSMSGGNSINMRPLFTGYPFQGISKHYKN